MPYKNKSKQSQYQNEWMKKRRLNWIKNNGPCKQCGSSKQLEVDHIDPNVKVTHHIWSWSKEKRLKELTKCQVLCSTCHKEKTKNTYASCAKHGSTTMYSHYKCRCDLCKQAHRDYMREYRKQMRQ